MIHRRIRFICECVFVFGLAAAVRLPMVQCAEQSTNIILIVADDLGWSDLGCYGSTLHRTPQLDRIAAEGIRFLQAYAACPVCSPTRAAILTGRWPARLHLTDWLPGRGDLPSQRLARPDFARSLPLEEFTLAEALREQGYATACIGKWHLGGSGFESAKQGFDLSIAGDQAGTPLSYLAPYRQGDRVLPGLEQAESGEYLTDRLTDEALRFIRSNAQRPFFLYLSHFAVHTPLVAKPGTADKFPAASTFAGRQNNPIYAAMLESLDEGVGKIDGLLRELSLETKTLVIFTSDNGGLATREGPHTPATSNAPLRDGKGYLYEGGIRVPLLVKGAGVVRRGVSDSTLVSSVDLFPTVASICGAKLQNPLDGVDLSPVLRGQDAPQRDAIYWHYPHYSNQGGRPAGCIREKNFKLIEYFELGRRELFDIEKDPGESRNLAEQEPEQVQRLARKLADWRDSVAAQMPSENAAYRPNPIDASGRVELHARTADVHGVMLRFEPMPHKDTLGYWVRADDWAEFHFTIDRPGTYQLRVWQGCGNGSGGSEVDFECGDQTLKMVVEETGGFQEFRQREIGKLELSRAGRHRIAVRPRSKPGPAVMDMRKMELLRMP